MNTKKILGAVLVSIAVNSVAIAQDNPAAIFDERIMPIFRSPDPSSCIQCHLSSVDLKNYILPSHEKTFLSLRDQGLIDVKEPGESKILKLIGMGHRDGDENARMIHKKMRQAELDAFTAWIEASCDDQRLLDLPALTKEELAKPEKPDEVIRHARKSRVVDSFVRNVWSQRMRCFPCHTPHEIGPEQRGAREKFEEWESQYGEEMMIFHKTPEQTIQYLVEQSKETIDGNLPLINLEDPAKSLLLLKPTSKVPGEKDGKRLPPSYAEPVSHMGGLKMHADDQSYKLFMAWLQDYANVVQGKYVSVDDLPADNWLGTQRVLRMKDIPQTWPVGVPVQMFVYAKTNDDAAWSSEPIAFTQGTVTPRQMVNGSLILIAPQGSESADRWEKAAERLSPGDFLIKVFVDRKHKLADDPTALLSGEDAVGQVELKGVRWGIGFKSAEVFSASRLKKQH